MVCLPDGDERGTKYLGIFEKQNSDRNMNIEPKNTQQTCEQRTEESTAAKIQAEMRTSFTKTERSRRRKTSEIPISISMYKYVLWIVFLSLTSTIKMDIMGGIMFAEASLENLQICMGDISFQRETSTSSFVSAWNSPAPVKFKFLRRTYMSNFPLKVVLITDQNIDMESFFIQAHELGKSEAIGSFNTTYTDEDITLISCGDSDQMDLLNTATTITANRQFRKRSQITLYWNPPSNFNKTVIFRVNAFTSDRPTQGWRGLTSIEIISKPKECFVGNGSSYRGSMDHTKSGIPCQRWDSQTPHTHIFSSEKEQFANKGLDSNFCRKPDKDSNSWCYTMQEKPVYEACGVRKCPGDDFPNHFIEFGETVGDIKLSRQSEQVGRINFTSGLPMIKATYKNAAVYEDGVLVLGIDASTINGIKPADHGSFSVTDLTPTKGKSTAVVAPFWTNVRRNQNSTGQNYVFYRESTEPDVILPLRDYVTTNLRHKDEDADVFEPTWAFIATWFLVSDVAEETNVKNLNSFQTVLTTNGNRSFVLFNYAMKKWTEKEHTALVGYKAGDGFRFLNHSLPYTKFHQFETASILGRAVTTQSNVGRPGQMMYEISMCQQPSAGARTKRCLDSLTLRLKAPDKPQQNKTTGSQGTSASTPNVCANVTCTGNKTCDTNTGECVCKAGYTGDQCQININDCQPNPCQNQGNCTDRINGYHCTCRPGYTGARCESNINDCFSSPCQNKGTCVDGVNSYRCICPPEYKGINCETLKNQCQSYPCKNGGECTPTNESYVCDCASGTSGKQCQYRYCVDGSCEGSHNCFDQKIRKYNCTCRTEGARNGYCYKVSTVPPGELNTKNKILSILSETESQKIINPGLEAKFLDRYVFQADQTLIEPAFHLSSYLSEKKNDVTDDITMNNNDVIMKQQRHIRVARSSETVTCEPLNSDTECYSLLDKYESYGDIGLPFTDATNGTHRTQKSASGAIILYKQLHIFMNCHDAFFYFACASTLPRCIGDPPETKKPCKNFCLRMKSSCEDRLYMVDETEWNTLFPCEQYPEDDAECVPPPTRKSTTTSTSTTTTTTLETTSATTAQTTTRSTDRTTSIDPDTTESALNEKNTKSQGIETTSQPPTDRAESTTVEILFVDESTKTENTTQITTSTLTEEAITQSVETTTSDSPILLTDTTLSTVFNQIVPTTVPTDQPIVEQITTQTTTLNSVTEETDQTTAEATSAILSTEEPLTTSQATDPLVTQPTSTAVQGDSLSTINHLTTTIVSKDQSSVPTKETTAVQTDHLTVATDQQTTIEPTDQKTPAPVQSDQSETTALSSDQTIETTDITHPTTVPITANAILDQITTELVQNSQSEATTVLIDQTKVRTATTDQSTSPTTRTTIASVDQTSPADETTSTTLPTDQPTFTTLQADQSKSTYQSTPSSQPSDQPTSTKTTDVITSTTLSTDQSTFTTLQADQTETTTLPTYQSTSLNLPPDQTTSTKPSEKTTSSTLSTSQSTSTTVSTYESTPATQSSDQTTSTRPTGKTTYTTLPNYQSTLPNLPPDQTTWSTEETTSTTSTTDKSTSTYQPADPSTFTTLPSDRITFTVLQDDQATSTAISFDQSSTSGTHNAEQSTTNILTEQSLAPLTDKSIFTTVLVDQTTSTTIKMDQSISITTKTARSTLTALPNDQSTPTTGQSTVIDESVTIVVQSDQDPTTAGSVPVWTPTNTNEMEQTVAQISTETYLDEATSQSTKVSQSGTIVQPTDELFTLTTKPIKLVQTTVQTDKITTERIQATQTDVYDDGTSHATETDQTETTVQSTESSSTSRPTELAQTTAQLNQVTTETTPRSTQTQTYEEKISPATNASQIETTTQKVKATIGTNRFTPTTAETEYHTSKESQSYQTYEPTSAMNEIIQETTQAVEDWFTTTALKEQTLITGNIVRTDVETSSTQSVQSTVPNGQQLIEITQPMSTFANAKIYQSSAGNLLSEQSTSSSSNIPSEVPTAPSPIDQSATTAISQSQSKSSDILTETDHPSASAESLDQSLVDTTVVSSRSPMSDGNSHTTTVDQQNLAETTSTNPDYTDQLYTTSSTFTSNHFADDMTSQMPGPSSGPLVQTSKLVDLLMSATVNTSKLEVFTESNTSQSQSSFVTNPYVTTVYMLKEEASDHLTSESTSTQDEATSNLPSSFSTVDATIKQMGLSTITGSKDTAEHTTTGYKVSGLEEDTSAADGTIITTLANTGSNMLDERSTSGNDSGLKDEDITTDVKTTAEPDATTQEQTSTTKHETNKEVVSQTPLTTVIMDSTISNEVPALVSEIGTSKEETPAVASTLPLVGQSTQPVSVAKLDQITTTAEESTAETFVASSTKNKIESETQTNSKNIRATTKSTSLFTESDTTTKSSTDEVHQDSTTEVGTVITKQSIFTTDEIAALNEEVATRVETTIPSTYETTSLSESHASTAKTGPPPTFTIFEIISKSTTETLETAVTSSTDLASPIDTQTPTESTSQGSTAAPESAPNNAWYSSTVTTNVEFGQTVPQEPTTNIGNAKSISTEISASTTFSISNSATSHPIAITMNESSYSELTTNPTKVTTKFEETSTKTNPTKVTTKFEETSTKPAQFTEIPCKICLLLDSRICTLPLSGS